MNIYMITFRYFFYEIKSYAGIPAWIPTVVIPDFSVIIAIVATLLPALFSAYASYQKAKREAAQYELTKIRIEEMHQEQLEQIRQGKVIFTDQIETAANENSTTTI